MNKMAMYYKKHKRCICGRTFSFLESFTNTGKCSACHRELIFFGDSIAAKYFKEYKKCLCGKPYFYLESLKKCPGCGRKLIFYGDVVEEVILRYYTCPCLISEDIGTFVDRVVASLPSPEIFWSKISRSKKEAIVKSRSSIGFFEMFHPEMFHRKKEECYPKDIIIFLKLLLKELEKKYRIIQRKEKGKRLLKLEKDLYRKMISKESNYNRCVEAYFKFFERFPVKSISREQILKDLQSHQYSEHEKKIIMYSFDHSIEKTGEKFGVTRERIYQINQSVFFKLYQNTKEYKEYERLNKECKKAEIECIEAKNEYYKTRNQFIKKNSKLSEKNPFENLIIKKIKYNQRLNALYKFFDEFPIKSVSKEQIFKDLQSSSYFSKWEPNTLKFTLNYKKDSKFIYRSIDGYKVNQFAFFELCKHKEKYQNTPEYKKYEKLEEKLKKAEEEYREAADRYYKSEKERAKRINRASAIH